MIFADLCVNKKTKTMKFLSFSSLLESISTATRRFPLSMLCAIVGTCSVLWLIDGNDEANGLRLARLALVCFYGLALLTGLALFSEKKIHSFVQKVSFQAVGLLVLVGCWFLFDPKNQFREVHFIVYSVGFGVLFHLFVSFAAFLDSDSKTEDFWEFNKQLFVNFLMGAAYSLIIFFGLAIALFAIKELFNVFIRDIIWFRMFTIIAGLFQTVYFLSNVPKDFEFDHTEIRYDLAIKNLVKWILIPIVGLYFLILYAYSGKILVTWQLPIGWASSLVVGFSVAGIFAWLMNFYLPKIDTSSIISGFRKYFWWMLAPMILLLFVAVFRRIRDYGLTEDRYLVAQCGVWLFLMSAYFIFFKKQDIRVIPWSLTVFVLIYLLPIIGGIDAGIRSQTNQLTEILEKNGLLTNGKATPKAIIFDDSDANRIRSKIEYLTERDAIEPMASWVGLSVDELKNDTSIRWNIITEMLKKLNVAEYAKENSSESIYKNLSWNKTDLLFALPISGFDSLHYINLSVEYDTISHQLALLGNHKILQFERKNHDLTAFLKNAFENSENSEDLLPIELVGETMRGRLILTNLAIDKSSSGLTINYLNGYLLTTRKR
jgi:Domain of unknown function (DUF4153)